MDRAAKLQVVEAILERVSEVICDITDPVMAEFYRSEPEAEQLFKQHRPVDTVWLEAGMVEQALYCFMRWHESPGEIEMSMLGSVPHHAETLAVSVDHYRKLINATATVIRNVIPPENSLEIELWDEITNSLHKIVDLASEDVIETKLASFV